MFGRTKVRFGIDRHTTYEGVSLETAYGSDVQMIELLDSPTSTRHAYHKRQLRRCRAIIASKLDQLLMHLRRRRCPGMNRIQTLEDRGVCPYRAAGFCPPI